MRLRRAGQAQPAVPVPPPVRPVPGANAWPDDAILLTYGELRRLIAVHLTLCASTAPRDRPWVWMKARARAVQDGEAPLLLSEVLTPDPPATIPPGRLTP